MGVLRRFRGLYLQNIFWGQAPKSPFFITMAMVFHMSFNQSPKICDMQGAPNSELGFYIYIDHSFVQGPAFARKSRHRSGTFHR